MTPDDPQPPEAPAAPKSQTVHRHRGSPKTLEFSDLRYKALTRVADHQDPSDLGENVGTTTRTIGDLTRSGLVEATTTVTYELTEAGRRVLAIWRAEADYEQWAAQQGDHRP